MPKDPSTKKKDNKEITNTKSPKQLNTETTTTTTTKQLGEKKKIPNLCSKSEKQSSLSGRKNYLS